MTEADKIMRQRDKSHHRNKDGYVSAHLDKISRNKSAIRGREQHLIDKLRAIGKCGNLINGVSLRNPKREKYNQDATNEFGKL